LAEVVLGVVVVVVVVAIVVAAIVVVAIVVVIAGVVIVVVVSGVGCELLLGGVPARCAGVWDVVAASDPQAATRSTDNAAITDDLERPLIAAPRCPTIARNRPPVPGPFSPAGPTAA